MKTSDSTPGVAVIDPAQEPHVISRVRRTVHTALAPTVPFGSAGFGRGDAFEFNALPDSVLLGWLTARGHRPNVLIECLPGLSETAMRHLMTWCALPFRYCALPGTLELPSPARGTLLLKDIGQMTLSQQVTLYDWLTKHHGQVQVISLTTTPLQPLVENGEFLEGLLYRLNVIRIDGISGTRPAPLDAWYHV